MRPGWAMKEHLILLRGRCALQEFDRIGPENGGTAMKDIVRMGEGIEEVREVIPGDALDDGSVVLELPDDDYLAMGLYD